MFRTILVACAALFFLASGNLSFGAEYKIQTGDTLTTVAHKTGHTVDQLVDMNEINVNDPLNVGQSIIYIDEADMDHAFMWAMMHVLALPIDDPNRQHFVYAAENINARRLRFSIKERSGTHFRSVLVYAKAYQEQVLK